MLVKAFVVFAFLMGSGVASAQIIGAGGRPPEVARVPTTIGGGPGNQTRANAGKRSRAKSMATARSAPRRAVVPAHQSNPAKKGR